MRSLLLSFCLFFIFNCSSYATHIVGADIYWKCLSDGKYQFHLTVYKDCSGIGWSFLDETLQINGSPLPTDSAGNSVSSILMRPDSVQWMASRMGDISPQCSDTTLSPISCSDRSIGSTQQFYYVSDPINLNGKPPRTGWTFYWTASCCTGGGANISNSGAMMLRAHMYRNATASPIDSCFDSSPQFATTPATYFCRGKINNYHSYAIDTDGDDVRHSFSQPYYTPITSPVTAVYNVGYGFKNPTPDTNFNSNNIPSSIGLFNGLSKFSVHNGVGSVGYYTSVKADAYRDGKLIARVTRQLPVYIMDCPTLADSTVNNTPIIKLDSVARNTYSVTVTAGDLVKIPIEVIDPDTVYGIPQEIKLTALGTAVSRNLSDENNCLDSNLKPCAYFQNASFKLDTKVSPVLYTIIDSSKINTELNWQTDCKHLKADGSFKDYYFYLTVQDNVCPIPLSNAAVITVRIKPDSVACGLTTSIPEINVQEGLKVFPNPTKGLVSILLNEHFQTATYTLRDISGKLIDEGEYMDPNRLNLQIRGVAGIYFLRLTNPKGQQANLKLVKH